MNNWFAEAPPGLMRPAFPPVPGSRWIATSIVATAGLICFCMLLLPQGKQSHSDIPHVIQTPAEANLPQADPQQGTYSQVVFIPDLHGDVQQGRSVLHMMGLIDEAGHWAGGATLLVQGGDMVDRGPRSLELLSLFANLSVEAKAVGGRVVNLLGNHELMLLQHDFRYFNREEVAGLAPLSSPDSPDSTGTPAAGTRGSTAAVQAGRSKLVELLRPDGWLGELLRSRPLAHISRGVSCTGCSCDMLFIHAAALPWMIDAALDYLKTSRTEAQATQQVDSGTALGPSGDEVVAAWNKVVSQELQGCDGRQCGQSSSKLAERLLGSEGGVWSRAYISQRLTEVCSFTQQLIEALRVSRVVVGHTVVKGGRAAVLCDGALLMTDIGMSTAYGGVLGKGVALRCAAGQDGNGKYEVSLTYGQGADQPARIVPVTS